MTLEGRLVRALEGADGPGPGEPVLLAVSGGVDSMTLLAVTADLARRRRLAVRPVAAHLHHGLRGREADEDQRLVETFCRHLGVPLYARRAEIGSGASVEDRARRVRRRFLADAARHFAARFVLLAHHADDQAETVLDRVLAGAGPDGLAGMRPRASLRSPPGESIVVIRPWLDVPRREIVSYAAAHEIAFREDAMNRDLRWRRSLLRHAVMPYLRDTVNPGLTGSLVRLGHVMRETAELVEAAAREALRTVVVSTPPALAWLVAHPAAGLLALDRRAFRSLAPPVRGAVLRLALRDLDPERPPLPGHRALGELARRLAGTDGGCSPWRIRRGLHALMDGATVLFARRPLAFRDPEAILPVYAAVGETVEPFPGVRVTACLGDVPMVPATPDVLRLDADTVGDRVLIRPRRAADRYQPLGSATQVALGAHLKHRSWPGFRRALALVVTDPGGRDVHGVLGLGPSEAAKVTATTQRILELRQVEAADRDP